MNSRRKFLLNGGIATSALLTSKSLKSFAKFSGPTVSFNENGITLIHTYDLHSSTFACTASQRHANDMIMKLRSNTNCLLLDTGTNYSGNMPEQGNDNKVLSMVKLMGYDVVLTGDPSFEGSLVTGENAGSEKPYRIIQKGHLRIAVIGAWVSRESGHTGEDPIESLSKLAAQLKTEERCNLVVCLSNLGLNNKNGADDILLATRSTNIDVILGSQPAGAEKQLASILLNKEKEEVVIDNAGHANVLLGKINIGFDAAGKKNRISFGTVLSKQSFTATVS